MCMPLILKAISKLDEIVENKEALPQWQAEILAHFSAQGTSLAVKLFIGRIIINAPASFEKYSSHWFQPILELACLAEAFGSGINYYLEASFVIWVVYCFVNLKTERFSLLGSLQFHCNLQPKN